MSCEAKADTMAAASRSHTTDTSTAGELGSFMITLQICCVLIVINSIHQWECPTGGKVLF
ncbi:MAG: hypothetical protein ACI9G1_006096 [Pirellulaceae bacterium]|jgi:hypothetical protein